MRKLPVSMTVFGAMLLFSLAPACSADSAGAPDAPGELERISDTEASDSNLGDSSPTDATGDDSGQPPELLKGDAEAVDAAIPTTPGRLPLALPFELTRPQSGEPLSGEEIVQFTDRMTVFWSKIRYFE